MQIKLFNNKQLCVVSREKRLRWLEIRLRSCLFNNNIVNRRQLLKDYKSGILLKLHNYGWASHKHVAKLLGLPEPHESLKKNLWGKNMMESTEPLL